MFRMFRNASSGWILNMVFLFEYHLDTLLFFFLSLSFPTAAPPKPYALALQGEREKKSCHLGQEYDDDNPDTDTHFHPPQLYIHCHFSSVPFFSLTLDKKYIEVRIDPSPGVICRGRWKKSKEYDGQSAAKRRSADKDPPT